MTQNTKSTNNINICKDISLFPYTDPQMLGHTQEQLSKKTFLGISLDKTVFPVKIDFDMLVPILDDIQSDDIGFCILHDSADSDDEYDEEYDDDNNDDFYNIENFIKKKVCKLKSNTNFIYYIGLTCIYVDISFVCYVDYQEFDITNNEEIYITDYIYDNIFDGKHKDVTLSKVYNVCHNFYNVKIKSIEIIDDFNTKN
jgi:hypothetical protein